MKIPPVRTFHIMFIMGNRMPKYTCDDFDEGKLMLPLGGYIMSFDSTQQALRAEMLLEYADLEIDTRPTPKEITAGCALSIGFYAEDLEQVKAIVRSERIEIHGMYFKQDNEYVTITV